MFAESGAYNVYAVADTREPRTLAGGVDVLPQLSFAELDARVPAGPDVILDARDHRDRIAREPFPARMAAPARRSRNPPLVVRRRRGPGCERTHRRPVVTTHWEDIDSFESRYPDIDWRRGVRYVDDGNLLTTGGLTAGVDGTLHFLATRDGPDVANRVADAIHYPRSSFAADPRAAQYSLEAVDAAVYLNLAFNQPKATAAIWLYDGIGEVDLAAAVEAFAVTSTNATTTVATGSAVVSQHGLQLVPRRAADEASRVDRVLVPGGTGASEAAARIPANLLARGRQPTLLQGDGAPAYAFTTDLQELAASNDVAIAEQAARHLEVRSPLQLIGPRWSARVIFVALFEATAGAALLWGAVRLARRARRGA